MRKFSLDSQAHAATFVLQKTFAEKFIANAVKVAISSMQSLTQDKKLA